ncbi:DUF2795 domain-containing protein [Streptomyces litchfieldiae]|uniref:DUF2795 domain-containing protein n=1 Tax=Streptomyces litchfieldiae TaxID=3075543 RepID=A0ABU2MUW3_9ACTN|nr:DUF2795 domain-containing protein [Streptomyces sp. DSM 44938]MDT0344633.1 DUF2795 domain-containing protein [Streptomyces sp. DSM 44938]
MQQRGSDRLNVHRDDVMKHELQGMLRGDHPTRAEDWHDPEPSAEDDPALTRGPVPPYGGAGTEEQEKEEFRSELARHLRVGVYPAHRDELLDVLAEENAPDHLMEAVRRLPADRSFANVQEVVTVLGRKPSA